MENIENNENEVMEDKTVETETVTEQSAETAEETAGETAEEVTEETTEETDIQSEEIPEEDGDNSEETENVEEDDFSPNTPQADVQEETENKENIFVQFGKAVGKQKKKIFITLGIIASVAAGAYAGGTIFYNSHFFYGTQVGGFDCSNLTPEEAKAAIENEIADYGFTFYEKDGREETIKGSEIYLESSPIENLPELKAKQNAFEWLTDKDNRTFPLNIEITFNEDSLYNRITEMQFMADTRSNMEGSTEKIIYSDGAYTVEDDGTKAIVSCNDIFDRVKPKIKELYKGMSLEKEGCYVGLAGDDKMKGVLNLLNQYVGTTVTYTKGDLEPTILNRDTINEWLSVGEDYSVNIDAEKARAYVDELAKGYDTVGITRKFKTTGGSEIEISGGSYGWNVNNQKETETLLENIRNGEIIEREPVYKQTAAIHGANNDIANTYVEVSIGAQHVWYYKDGELALSTDCVTGNTSLGRGTHKGVYYVMYKDRNAILKGQGYETPVSFWMPFNGGEGLHDATWRGAFGGTIYQGAGSHGCVNLPYSAAQTLYSKISPGDPVIVY